MSFFTDRVDWLVLLLVITVLLGVVIYGLLSIGP